MLEPLSSRRAARRPTNGLRVGSPRITGHRRGDPGRLFLELDDAAERIGTNGRLEGLLALVIVEDSRDEHVDGCTDDGTLNRVAQNAAGEEAADQRTIPGHIRNHRDGAVAEVVQETTQESLEKRHRYPPNT